MRPGGTALTLHLAAKAKLPRGARVLDIGCGRGCSVACLCDNGFVAIGIDKSEALLKEGFSQYSGLDLRLANANSLPFGDAEFDAVLLECVLSVTDAAAALSECRRVIKTEGAILVSDIYDAAAMYGAYSKAHWLELFEEAGFCRIIFEDHTQALRNFAAQLIWRGHSLERFKACAACAIPAKPGYFTLIAQY